MRHVKMFYWDYDGDKKVLKDTIVEVYCCPHCDSDLFQSDRDIGRGLFSCDQCDYAVWISKDGEEREDMPGY